MPIKLKCNCGQSLTVPDSLAGKTGKCPKCQAALKIPAAGEAAGRSSSAQSTTPPAAPAASVAKPQSSATKSTASKSATSKPAVPKSAAAAPTASAKTAAVSAAATVASAQAGMDDLLDEVGLKKKTGPTCPKCGGAIQRNAALCTHCGFHLQTGEQSKGFNAQTEEEEFKNPFLQEAANNMRRDVLGEERHAKAGTPWWMLASFLLGALCIGTAGVILVDATMNEPAPVETFLGKLQRQKFGVVAGVTFAAVGASITLFAWMSVVIFAFGKSVGRGFATLFPPYAFIYACGTWADNKSGVFGLLMGGALLGAGLWLNQYSGGVNWNPPAGETRPQVGGLLDPRSRTQHA